MPLSVGTGLGPYEILAPIGAGGMGEVYRARDTRLKRDVALKVLPDAFARDPGRMARFQREAEVLASLNHPNIAAIYGLEDNAIVMELVEGPTLAERIKAAPLPLEEALTIARAIADALEAAHERGIVHRDLKPANIKAPPDGTVKVLDLGLATVLPGSDREVSDPAISPTLAMDATQAGVILGTAAYMSPEQACGKKVDKRADIWAFGVVLWEMLTRQRLFQGETVSHTLADVLRAEIDFRKLPANTPPPIRELLKRCLDRDVKTRLRDIGEARVMLENPMLPAAPPQATFPRFHWAWPGMAALSLAMFAAMAWIHFRQAPLAQHSIRFQIAPPEKSTFQELALSPDGRYLAFIDLNELSIRRLWVRPLDSVESHVLPGTEGAQFPFWSPDSHYVAFFAGGQLRKISVTGGPSALICEAARVDGGTWNRDGVILFAGASGGIYRVAASGGVPAIVVHTKGSEAALFPQFLPGKRFLYTFEGQQGGIFAGSLDGAEPVRILPDDSSGIYVPLSQDGTGGHIVFRRDNTLVALPFDPDKLRATGEAFALAESVGGVRKAGFGKFSASSNGVLTYGSAFLGRATQLVWVDRSGKRLGIATKLLPVCCTGHHLSPDGTQAMVALAGSGSAPVDIWLQDLTRGRSSRFTFAGHTGSAAWSPDGGHVAFTTRVGNSSAIYAKPVSGGKEDLLAIVGPDANVLDWSRDGRFLVLEYTVEKTGYDLWLLPLAGDHKPIPYVASRFEERNARFSPDGKWMAYTSDESGQVQVWIESIPAGNGRWQISTEGGNWPEWRRDGKELYYWHEQKIVAVPISIRPSSAEAGRPEELFDGTDGRFEVSADGNMFLLTLPAAGEAAAPPVTVWVNWQAGLKK